MNSTLKHGLLSLFLALVVLLPFTPYFQPIPAPDSGVFLYSAEKILGGEKLYTQIWDHKGPLIHYLNVLGLTLSPGSAWGIWWLEWVSLAVAIYFSLKIGAEFFQGWKGIAFTVFWVSHLFALLEGGNFTEEFTLPLQTAAIFLFVRGNQRKGQLPFIFIGALSALAFFLRGNNIGFSVAVLATLCLQLLQADLREQAVKKIIGLLIGSSLVALGVAVFFYQQHGLEKMVEESILYNFAYIGTNDPVPFYRLKIFLAAFIQFFPALALVGGLQWGQFIGKWKRGKLSAMPELEVLLIFWIPIEFVFALAAGNAYRHYFVLVLFPLGLAFGFFLHQLKERQQFSSIRKNFYYFLLVGVVISEVMLVSGSLSKDVSFFQQAIQTRQMPPVRMTLSVPEKALQQLNSHLVDQTSLLVWGDLVSLNFVLGKENPTMYPYPFPLFRQGYTNLDKVVAYWDRIAEARPLIVDTHLDRTDYIVGLDSNSWDLVPEETLYLRDQILAHYQPIDVIEPYGWVVYRYAGGE